MKKRKWSWPTLRNPHHRTLKYPVLSCKARVLRLCDNAAHKITRKFTQLPLQLCRLTKSAVPYIAAGKSPTAVRQHKPFYPDSKAQHIPYSYRNIREVFPSAATFPESTCIKPFLLTSRNLCGYENILNNSLDLGDPTPP